MRKVRVGTRASRLALAQVEEITQHFGEVASEIKTFSTRGDLDKKTPIEKEEGTDFFTDEIEKALIKGEIDLAVHSAKDLPDKIPEELEIAIVTSSIDKDDVLVSRENLPLEALSAGARIGTSSKRRKEQIFTVRPDLEPLDLRGNIDERLEKLDKGEFDAIVVAAAALARLGLEKRITQRLPFETAKGQGSLALEIRKKDVELKRWLQAKFI